MNSSHRIETISWEARFEHARLAQQQQERLSRFIHQQALPCLARRFDAFSPPDEVWTVDRLEIDIGQLRVQDSPAQWLQQFDAALQRSLARLAAQGVHGLHAGSAASAASGATGRPLAAGRQSGASHELGQFLYYLQHGLLPWGLPLRSARDLAGWLERLALQHGPRLWQALQQLMPPEPVLARLALIAPHAGLQALLSVRHRELAEAMLLLDEAWLAPLQTRGRLSAYQVQSLQQRLRAAGLHALWGLSGGALGGARQRRLLGELQASHAELLGPGWISLQRALEGQVLPRQPGSELAAAMLRALLGVGTAELAIAAAPAERQAESIARQEHDEPSPAVTRQAEAPLSRLAQAAWRRLQQQLDAWAAGRAPAGSDLAAFSTALAELHRQAPAGLRHSLREQLRRRAARRAWSQALPAEHSWPLLALLADRGEASSGKAPGSTRPQNRTAPPQWADSLRQTALQLLSHCPAEQRPGLSTMQSLLLEASLAYLLEHGRAPSSHSAWLAVWHGAWARWQRPEAPAADQALGPAASASEHERDQASARLPSKNLPVEQAALLRLQRLPWLPGLIAVWQPGPGPASAPSATSETDKAAGISTDSGAPSDPSWTHAGLRRWLWQEAELLAALPGAALTEAGLRRHWQARWPRSGLPHPQAAMPASNAADVRAGDSAPKAATEHPSQALNDEPEHQPSAEPARAAPLAEQLQQLWQHCEARRYGPTDRLRLAELLERPEDCQQWCTQFDEAQRWRWLAAQFGDSSANSLRRGLDQLLAEIQQPQPRSIAQADEQQSAPSLPPSGESLGHGARAPQPAVPWWPLLCEHLFVLAGPPDAAALRRHYLNAITTPARPSSANASTAQPAPTTAPQAAVAGLTTAAIESALAGDPPPAVAPKPVSAARPVAKAPAPAPRGPLAAPIWVDDAGQVLLAAYAERLFKHLGLIEAGKFVDAEAQARAVLCLQALVRGEAPSSEPLWPLSKLLCGLAPNDLLPACEPLSATEHALLADLLVAVIAHWKAIGKTSVAGLRESFLQREGRLERQKASDGEPPPWRLKVQPRAFDMLLDRLPWGFSIIKLPWMQGVLHVEWR
ncbi:contractile injection system tape measure protein [Paucibacter sp. APW11]|uniref:Contractile injection system tape measure protein n=1 Tax=Roseateles aquae TaxID=3077235 RepID=A0ABU3P6M1_9BURK|nr:contractile injection system tape measure protein [Paucibacter sp. APW11]MDT8998209.1 contractile injection system tape measure protein [Paucibacter sp. APW11]